MAECALAMQRGTLKRLDEACKGFFRRVKAGATPGFPRFKGRAFFDSISIVSGVKVRDGTLHVPSFGRVRIRRKGGNPYPDGRPVSAVLKRTGGKWHAIVCYAVAVAEAEDKGHVLGLDRNCGQVADSDGCLHGMPDMARLSRDMCRRLRCCIPHHVQMFFDRMHDHLRRAGRRVASLDDVEWVYVREMQGVRGQVDLQHYEGRLETVLGRAGYTVALEILTSTAVDGGIAAETVDRYREHFSTRDAHDGDAAPSVDHVLHVLQHDGYLEPEDDGYRFVSGLVEDWWRGRYGQRFVPVFDPQR